MPSSYLSAGDYETFGLPSTTTAGSVNAASTLIDMYLKRPEGLAWSPDGSGAPAWMTGLSPMQTLTCAAAIEPGENVRVTLAGGVASLSVGEVLIMDRASPSAAEAVAIVSIAGQQVILKSVMFEHAAQCTFDKGMTIKQHKFVPDGRPVTNLAFTPVARLLSGQGRYGYGRRGDSSRYQVDEFNLLASLSHFGGPPVWEFFPMENTGVDFETGMLWVPAGVMLAYYSEVNLWYVAGYPATGIPAAIKMACANIIQAQANRPQLGAARSYKAGDTAIESFAATVIDDDTKAALAPFKAKLFV
jgi:hypothetical protein